MLQQSGLTANAVPQPNFRERLLTANTRLRQVVGAVSDFNDRIAGEPSSLTGEPSSLMGVADQKGPRGMNEEIDALFNLIAEMEAQAAKLQRIG